MQSAKIHPSVGEIQWEGLFPRRFFQASVFHPLRWISDGVVLGCPVYLVKPSVPCSIPTIPMVPQHSASREQPDTKNYHAKPECNYDDPVPKTSLVFRQIFHHGRPLRLVE